MALTTCPDCGTEVSEQAPSCPKCGRPMAGQIVTYTGRLDTRCGAILPYGMKDVKIE